ncbi:MAG: endo alpha-1,4 polygalactosaminidase [Thermomicrobiales bacterium]
MAGRALTVMGWLMALTLGFAPWVSVSARDLASPPVETAIWQPASGTTWQIQFSEPLSGDPLAVAVYDLDGFDTDAKTVAMLKANGIRTLCYMDMGTWEDWRPDASAYPESVLGKAWDEWPGERYLDIRQVDVLAPILEARLDLCAAKGFDAVEPDNIDTYGNDASVTGFALTAADQLRFNRWLADAAHARGLAIGQKNVPELTPDLVGTYDFAVTEDCVADGWCDQMKPYLDAGKAVFAIEYTDRTPESAFVAICAETMEPLSFVLKHRNLDAWRVGCA